MSYMSFRQQFSYTQFWKEKCYTYAVALDSAYYTIDNGFMWTLF